MSALAPGLWLPDRRIAVPELRLPKLVEWWRGRTAQDALVAALSVIGTPVCVASSSVTLPTHAIGDLIEICAYRDGSTTVPSKPAASGTVPAWVDIDAPAGGNTNSMRVAQFVATATNHTSGTWTNATGMGAIVRRGQHATPIGGHAQGGTANSTGVVDLNLGAVTLSVTDGSSAIDRWVGARNVTAWGSAPAGWTLLASVSTELALLTKDTTTSEDASGDNFSNTFSANGGFRVQGVETVAAAVAAANSGFFGLF
jgi:hypothetical protein